MALDERKFQVIQLSVDRLREYSAHGSGVARRIEVAVGCVVLAISLLVVTKYQANSQWASTMVIILACTAQSVYLGGVLGRWKARSDIANVISECLVDSEPRAQEADKSQL
jgi:ABC-type proline/glycine betaine transport system permease subunit